MTSTSVSNVNSFYSGMGKVNKVKQSNLANYFNQAINEAAAKKDTGEVAASTVKASKTKVDSAQKIQQKRNNMEDKLEEAVSESDRKEPYTVDEKISNVVNEAAEKVKTEVMDKLDISEEELVSAMEQLGLQFSDLLNPQNIVDLSVLLTGGENALALLTNESVYSDVKALLGTVEDITADLLKELGITQEDLQKVLQSMQPDKNFGALIETAGSTKTLEIMPKEPVPDLPTAKDAVAPVDAIDVDIQKENAFMQGGKGEDGQKTSDESLKEEQPKQNEVLSKDMLREAGKAVTTVPEEIVKAVSKEAETKTEDGIKTVDIQLNTQTIGVQEIKQSEVLKEVPLPKLDTLDIMKQISEQVKIKFMPEITEMELRLHPESLGNIHLHVASKNGVITAQLAAENEAVKKILETQITQLRENLSEQGLKVEAVEVTVANHGFGRNLDSEGDSSKEGKQAKEKGKRRINLNSLGELNEELTEEDELAVSMMNQNGNSIDFTA